MRERAIDHRMSPDYPWNMSHSGAAPIQRILFAACPLCESPKIVQERTADCTGHELYKPEMPAQIRWQRCENCRHVFTDGYFSPEDAAQIANVIPEQQRVGFDMERQRLVSARIIERVLPYVDEGVWLDVGFGNGSLLFAAHEYGFVPIGTELRAENVAKMKAVRVEVHRCDIADLSLDRPCAVVSMADVLEHMPYPKLGLAAARRLLADNGVLLLSMPNSDCAMWRALDNNPYWSEVEHYHNFGRRRLYDLLRECGFEPLKYGVSERYIACMEIVARKRA